MTKRALQLLLLGMLLSALMAVSVTAATGTAADRRDQARADQIDKFNVGLYPMESRQAVADLPGAYGAGLPASGRHSVGTAMSANAGQGPGASIDLTFDDAQWTWGRGNQIAHYYNGLTGVDATVAVHFSYRDTPDTIPGIPYSQAGYNVVIADGAGGIDWPHLQNTGCELQSNDTGGYSTMPSLDMMDNGRVVMGVWGDHNLLKADGTYREDNMVYYQDAFLNYNCDYDPTDGTFGNVTWVDTTTYRHNWMENDAADGGNYSRDPIVATQLDAAGTSTIVHLILQENYTDGVAVPGIDYSTNSLYHPVIYYQKTGNTFDAGSWGEEQIIDSITFVWTSLAAAPYPNAGVAVCYVNDSDLGASLNNSDDVDVWCRESFNRGVDWADAYSITNYTNGIPGHPNHFTAWLESRCWFDQEGDLHAIWAAKPTSADPYFDGFNWQDFDENVYHWEKDNGTGVPGTGYIVKVANGNFMNDDMLTGSMNTLHCGFGGANAGYLGFMDIGQCNDKLYILWGQIHERANRFPWRDVETVPAPGVLDDCSYTGERLAMANWEIMMSVAKLNTSWLWDAPRNVSDTYTPDCGIDGDPEAAMLCGSEWKASVENFALDETGLTGFAWPTEAVVDLSPDPIGDPYTGSWFLNVEYLDDQFPGPYAWGRTNPPATLNSEKWIRLACVEPIEASQIRVMAIGLNWPSWVPTGVVTTIPMTVVNEGNVVLNVTGVTTTEDGPATGWLDVIYTLPYTVPAGIGNTGTMDIEIDATGITQPTWLDGTITVASDAANFPSYDVTMHLLAADHVEPVYWDTVQTHQLMYIENFFPEGEVVGLSISNHGDLGWGAGSPGGLNLDYVESGLECGERARDGYYLIGASAFTIMADASDGTNATLTQVFNDGNQVDETGWDPTNDKGSMLNGQLVSTSGEYDSAYTGRFVNRDTTIAMERTLYGPRPQTATPDDEILNFMILYTKVYSADGAAHDHVTIGNVCDWDIPADSVPDNTSHLGSNFVYLAGTDTVGHDACQSNVNRLATEAFGGGYTSAEWQGDNCVNDPNDYYNFAALIQTLMVDTTHYRDGTPLDPWQPNPLVWWDDLAAPGLHSDATVQDQAVWFTYKYDYSLGATDTLHYWTVLTTTRDTTHVDGATAPADPLDDLEAQVAYAKAWYMLTVRGCEPPPGCCDGEQRGDVNLSSVGAYPDLPTIGDISAMIDAKFISNTCGPKPGEMDPIIACLDEGDVNNSSMAPPDGIVCEDITIGDISLLIDYLFITGPTSWSALKGDDFNGFFTTGEGKLRPCP